VTEANAVSIWPAPTVDEIAMISAMSDASLRNLKITQAYHDLKVALARIFGSENVTWCAYATWASKTAGRFIRGEEVPSIVRGYLERTGPASQYTFKLELGDTRIHAHLDDDKIIGFVESILTGVQSNVAQGNLLVFQELAPPYARMLEEFAKHFTPGPVESGGQDLLIESFGHYYRAYFERDPKKRAEYLFLANSLAGYHEQIRLQEPIAQSLNAPLQTVVMTLLHAQATADLPHEMHGVIREFIEKAMRPIASKLEAEWREFSTRFLMKLMLPEVTLDLGVDVPFIGEGRSFPEVLATVENARLLELLAKLDRTPNSLTGSAARDWASLDDRMNYVVDFFRSRQQDPTLYLAPFTADQVESIRRDTFPPGPL
jgi:hypothetical protein